MNSTLSFMGAYQRRVIDSELDALFPALPAVLLDGPKGVGKTATASQRCATERRLDQPSEAAVATADPRVIENDPKPLLIDEWQRVPATFDVVRRLVDDNPAGGQFLLTGSAPTAGTHSGAGRITSFRMRPLTLPERGVETPSVAMTDILAGSAHIAGRTTFSLRDYVNEILASGFPGMRHLEGRALERQLDSYIGLIVSHDLPEAGFTVRRPATVMAWLRAYAAATGTTATWEKIRNAATSGEGEKPAKTTTLPYIELLTTLRILDPIEAWSPTHNHLRDLTQSQKHFLADPALSARLVQRSATQLLAGKATDVVVPRDGGFLGGLFEALAALSVRTFAQNCDARVYHLRTKAGRHEVDFIVDGPEGIVGLEVKLASVVNDKDVEHLKWLRQQLGDHCVDLVVLYTGPEAYRRGDGVAVIPLALLGP